MAQNGQLPASMLRPIHQGRLRADAAAAWNAMNVERRRQGREPLRPTGSRSSYRDLAGQQYFWNLWQTGKGNLAARPGTSNHGWGLAVDVPTTEMANWINANGARFGWQKRWSDAPSEWWHFRWREGHWKGPDPGPLGQTPTQPPKPPEDTVRLKAVKNRDGRLEAFVWRANGDVRHTWQTRPNGGWAGSAPGRNASWYGLGNPGKGEDMDVIVRNDGAIVILVRLQNGTVMRRSQSKANGQWTGGWSSLGNPGK